MVRGMLEKAPEEYTKPFNEDAIMIRRCAHDPLCTTILSESNRGPYCRTCTKKMGAERVLGIQREPHTERTNASPVASIVLHDPTGQQLMASVCEKFGIAQDVLVRARSGHQRGHSNQRIPKIRHAVIYLLRTACNISLYDIALCMGIQTSHAGVIIRRIRNNKADPEILTYIKQIKALSPANMVIAG